MKACANLGTMFTDVPMDERFGAACSAGFAGVEIPFPYDFPVPSILERLAQNDLSFVMLTCPPPNYTGGDRGFAAVPGQETRFRQDFKRTLRYAKALGCQHIHIMAGAVRGPAARDVFEANLRWALAEAPGQSLTIEPMCHEDVPGYYLNDIAKGAEVVRAIGADTLGLQFDTHHVQQIHGDVLAQWTSVADIVHHVQLAQSPMRVAPDQPGDVDIKGFLKAVKSSGYRGWISGEYMAAPTDRDHLFWL